MPAMLHALGSLVRWGLAWGEQIEVYLSARHRAIMYVVSYRLMLRAGGRNILRGLLAINHNVTVP